MAKVEYHETAAGDLIKIMDLTDDHLANIIKMIERKAKEGIDVVYGGGHGDYDEMWGDVEHLHGEEVLDHFDYKKYKKEQRRRNRILGVANLGDKH